MLRPHAPEHSAWEFIVPISLCVTSTHGDDSVLAPALYRVSYNRASASPGESQGVGRGVRAVWRRLAVGEVVRAEPLPLATGWRARPPAATLEGTHYGPRPLFIFGRWT